MKVDIEQIKERILPPEVASMIQIFDNGKFPIRNGEFRVVVKNGMITTIPTEDM